jgi:hypothetical protein
MTLISGPVIAKLALCTRKWAHEHLRRGTFGPVIEHSGVLYAEVSNVERALGETLPQAQLVQAAGGKPDRILTIEPQEVAA